MQKRILKFCPEFSNVDHIARIMLPIGARVIAVAGQHGQAFLWVEVDNSPGRDFEERRFEVVGTGWDFSDLGRKYVGTAFCDIFVWHVYEVLL